MQQNEYADESSEPDSEHSDDSESTEDVDHSGSKQEWFWNSKDAYNNIKINQNAPDQKDLMPIEVSKNLRNWWFFHQDDYQPFNDNLE